jgi:hypothetical protein
MTSCRKIPKGRKRTQAAGATSNQMKPEEANEEE